MQSRTVTNHSEGGYACSVTVCKYCFGFACAVVIVGWYYLQGMCSWTVQCFSLFQMCHCCPFSCLYLFISLGFNSTDVIKLFECS
jgi:hypothetical protein